MLKLHDMIETTIDLTHRHILGHFESEYKNFNKYDLVVVPKGSPGEIVDIDPTDSEKTYRIYWHFDCEHVTLWVHKGWIQGRSEAHNEVLE